MDEAILKVINTLATLAPEVWGILLKQVYANVAGNIVWLVVWAVVVFISLRGANWGKQQDDWETSNASAGVAIIFGYIGAVIGSILFAMILTETIKMLYNPEYYAIQIILSKVGGR